MRFKMFCTIEEVDNRYIASTSTMEFEVLIAKGVHVEFSIPDDREFFVCINKLGGLTVLLVK